MAENTRLFDLTPYNIQRPEKIDWLFPDPKHIEETILSKSLKTFYRRTEEFFQKDNITWEYKPLSEADYLSWLPYYEQKMKESGFDIIATPEWYQKKTTAGFFIEGLFCYREGKVIGSIIISRKDNEIITTHFKASDKISFASISNSSLGAALDCLFLKHAQEQHFQQISFGRARNAFGVTSSLGYLDYKLRFGFTGQPAPDVPLHNDAPLNEEGVVLFYGLQNKQLHLFALKPKALVKTFEQSRFGTPEIPFTVVEY